MAFGSVPRSIERPVATHEANTTGIEFLKKLSISDADREKIAHGNAERLLRM